MAREFSFHPFPNGWFLVGHTDELKVGDVKPLKYFGKDLVLFRTADGKASVLDAFCAHLGAHLGYGGVVDGNSIRCPFHAWEFSGEGQCTKIPYATKIPAKAVIAPWQVRELNGIIFVWHHAEGQAPTWEVPVLPEYGHEEWTPYEKRQWKIKTRNQEMAENSVDAPHFRYVHGTQNMPKSTASCDGIVMTVKSNTTMTTPGGEVEGFVESISYGFGFSTIRFTGLVETLLVSSVIPIDEEYVDVRFHFAVKKVGGRNLTKGIGAAFMTEVERQLGQDIPIWENKKYHDKPVICDGDGPIGLFRNWCKQFYSPMPQPPVAV